MKCIKTVAFFGLCLPWLAMAQANTPRIDQRQIDQATRIQQGEASGSLTHRESMRLEQGQARVQSIETKARADGIVTQQERHRLHHAQNVQGDRIYRQKHDRQHDYNHNGRNDHRLRRG